MTNKLILAAVLGIIAAVPAANAQQVNAKKTDKVTFFNAPRQFQILDERPIIKDFREAPSAPNMIQLPPPPQGFGGGMGGGGAGAMPGGGDGMGGAPVQLQAPPGYPAYRNPTNPMGALPKSGFGGPSNIPAGGMGPRTALPNGQSTGVHANLMTPIPRAAASAGPGRAMRAAPVAAAPAATYGGPSYTRASGPVSSGGGMSSSSNVSGSLLTKIRGNR